MHISEIAVLSSKGQVTVPAPIREIFSLKKGSAVMFKVTDRGVFFMPVEIKERTAYTPAEWRKIEHLVAERGKTYKTSKGARKHLTTL